MKAKLGNMSTFYNLDIETFKKEFGITGYVKQNLRLSQIADKYNIPEEKILAYLSPFVMYNGWYNILGDSNFFRAVGANIYVCVLSILLGGARSALAGAVKG